MSDIDTDEVLVQDELSSLKARADMLGLSYHPSIGVEKLRAKINDALTNEKTVSDEEAPAPKERVAEVETENQKRARLQREAGELVRIKVTCMNPAKNEWEGEIFTVGNSVVGTYKKYVPFNNDEGWHVPRVIYETLRERQCQIFTTTRDGRGNSTRTGKLIKEFAIEVLPNLTGEELSELARRQAMAKAID